MAKAYWIAFYKSISDQEKFAAYAKLAPGAIQAYGGRFVVRGPAVQAWENGLKQRVVVIEFPSLEKALAAHDSPEYGEALRALGGAADRDLRVVEGLE
ncbi:MAG TPA: DUF1330 domain-containing protein [Burkholderiales bacterium]|nr:DUF1330 domain-containing protein [Burkholderiales bacterium]